MKCSQLQTKGVHLRSIRFGMRFLVLGLNRQSKSAFFEEANEAEDLNDL